MSRQTTCMCKHGQCCLLNIHAIDMDCNAKSPGQTDSQGDPSWKVRSTSNLVLPNPLYLRWLALTLAEMKSTQVFHCLATKPTSMQVEWCVALKWISCDLCGQIHLQRNLQLFGQGFSFGLYSNVHQNSKLTSSKTIQCPALSAFNSGPSLQTNWPASPPSTGRSAPNRSVTSFKLTITTITTDITGAYCFGNK